MSNKTNRYLCKIKEGGLIMSEGYVDINDYKICNAYEEKVRSLKQNQIKQIGIIDSDGNHTITEDEFEKFIKEHKDDPEDKYIEIVQIFEDEDDDKKTYSAKLTDGIDTDDVLKSAKNKQKNASTSTLKIGENRDKQWEAFKDDHNSSWNEHWVDDNENGDTHGKIYWYNRYLNTNKNNFASLNDFLTLKKENKINKDDILLSATENIKGTTQYDKIEQIIGSKDDKKIGGAIQVRLDRLKGFDLDNATPEELREYLEELAIIAYAADTVCTWADHIRTMEDSDDRLKSYGYIDGQQGVNFRAKVDTVLEKTTKLRQSASDKITDNINNIANNAKKELNNIGVKDDGTISFSAIDKLDPDEINNNIEKIASFKDDIKEYISICNDYGIVPDKKSVENLDTFLVLGQETKDKKSAYAQNYINALAESIEVDLDNEVIGDTITSKEAYDKVETIINNLKENNYDTSKLESVKEKLQGDNQKEVEDTAKKISKGSTGSSSGSTGTVGSSSGTRSGGSNSSLVDSVRNSLAAANAASETADGVQSGTGGSYALDTSSLEEIDEEFQTKAQEIVDNYASELENISSAKVEGLTNAYNSALGTIEELQQSASQIDLSALQSASESIKTKAQELADKEAQQIAQEANNSTSGTIVGNVIDKLAKAQSDYSGYNIDLSQFTNAINTLKENQEKYLTIFSQSAKLKLDSATSTEEVQSVLENVNAIIQENQKFNTSELQSVSGYAAQKLDELSNKKELDPIAADSTDNSEEKDETTDIKETENNPNQDPEDEGSNIEVSLSGVTYKDDTAPSISFVTEDDNNEEENPFSLVDTGVNKTGESSSNLNTGSTTEENKTETKENDKEDEIVTPDNSTEEEISAPDNITDNEISTPANSAEEETKAAEEDILPDAKVQDITQTQKEEIEGDPEDIEDIIEIEIEE